MGLVNLYILFLELHILGGSGGLSKYISIPYKPYDNPSYPCD